MAVVDEASVKITPDTSGFASELRAELEAAIEEATAGLDKTIQIKVETDADAARDRLRQAMQDFSNDGASAFSKLKDDEQELFADINANAEKSRIKQTNEQTKLRDKLRALWRPAAAQLKQEQIAEKIRLDQITESATKAAKAVGQAFGGGDSTAIAKAEAERAKAYAASEAAAEKLRAAQERLVEAQRKLERASTEAEQAEAALARTHEVDAIQAEEAAKAERRLDEAHRSGTASTQELQRLEADLDRARQASAGNAQRTADVEDRVNEVRNRSAQAAANVADAEERVRAAREKATDSARKLDEAELRVADAHERSASQAHRSAEEHRKLGGVWRAIKNDAAAFGRETDKTGNILEKLGGHLKKAGNETGIFGKLTKALGGAMHGAGAIFSSVSGIASGLSGIFSGAAGASKILTDALGGLGGGLKEIAGSALSAAGAILQTGIQFSIYALIAGAVSYAVGAVGAALAGIPALAFAAAASFAVVALGMDGIKKAYNVGLKPALETLKKQVSEVFEKGLTPIFQQLATKLIPAITGQMKILAQAFVDVAGDIVNVVATAPGIAKIQSILTNTAQVVSGQLGPALANLVRSFLDVAAQGAILQNMVGIIADIANNVASWLDQMNRLNLIQPAVEALRSALDTVEKVLLNVLTSAIRFFTQATPGFEHLVESVGRVVSALLDRLGPAFGTAMDAAATLLDSIPQSVWDDIGNAVKRLADKFMELARNKDVQEFFRRLIEMIPVAIDSFTTLIGIIRPIAQLFNTMAEAVQSVGEALGLLPDPTSTAEAQFRAMGLSGADLEAAMRGVRSGAEAVPPPLDAAGAAADRAGGQIQSGFVDPITGLPAQVQPPMDESARAVEESTRRAQEAAQRGGQGTHDGWVNGINPIPGATQVTFDTLPRNIQDAMTNSITAATVGSDLIRTAVETGFNNAANAARTAMTGMQTAVGDGFQAIALTAAVNMTAVQASVEQGAAAIAKSFQAMAQAAQNGSQQIAKACQEASAAAQRMHQTVQAAMTGMATAVTTAMERIQNITTQTFEKVDQVVTTTMQKVKTTIQQNLQAITQNFEQFYQQLLQKTQQSWDRMEQIIQAAGNKIVALCQDIAKRILQVFVALAPQLEAAGNTMMDRLSAGIIAGGARAVAAAQQVAARIKAQFPASPAKEGPLSGKGDPLRTGGVIIHRLADGMRSAQEYLLRQLVPIMNATAQVIAGPGVAMPTNGWSVTSSTTSSEPPPPMRVLDKPSSAPNENWWEGQPQNNLAGIMNSTASGGQSSGVSAQDIRAALEGMSIRFDDRGNGLAKLVASQQRSLARR